MVFLTGDAYLKSTDTLARGVVGYVVKPFHASDLLDAVRAGMRWSEAHRKHADAIARLEQKQKPLIGGAFCGGYAIFRAFMLAMIGDSGLEAVESGFYFAMAHTRRRSKTISRAFSVPIVHPHTQPIARGVGPSRQRRPALFRSYSGASSLFCGQRTRSDNRTHIASRPR